MKNFKMVLAALVFCFATVAASANEPNPKSTKESNQLHTTIVSLLGDEIPDYKIKEDFKANVYLMVNNDNEILVVSVNSKCEELETFVKNKLNYKEVSVKGIKKGEIYKVPLTVKQS